METIFKLLLALVVLVPVILFLVRALALGPVAVAQVSADGTKGLLNQVKATLHYLYNAEKLKTIYIRDGNFTHKPVSLVRSAEDRPADTDNQT